MTKEITVSEDRIRERAYLISEEAGHPHGRCDEFWHRARSELHAAAAAALPLKARRTHSRKTAEPVPTKPAPVRRASKAKTASSVATKSVKKAEPRLAKPARKASAKTSSGARRVRGSAKA